MGLLGIGHETLEIQIENDSVIPGQNFKGSATLILSNDAKGKDVIVTLFALRKVSWRGTNRDLQQSEIETYSQTTTLDGEKTYSKTNSPYIYTFNLVMPQTDQDSSKLIETITKHGIPNSGWNGSIEEVDSPHWYVKVEFEHDAVLSFSLSKTQEISVAPTNPESSKN